MRSFLLLLIQYDWKLGHINVHGKDRVRTGRKQPSRSQGERPQKKPRSQTSCLWNCEKISFCWLSGSWLLGHGRPSKQYSVIIWWGEGTIEGEPSKIGKGEKRWEFRSGRKVWDKITERMCVIGWKVVPTDVMLMPWNLWILLYMTKGVVNLRFLGGEAYLWVIWVCPNHSPMCPYKREMERILR